MHKILIAAAPAFAGASLLAVISSAAMADCLPGRDCGTVIATGFGEQCAWVRVKSSVFHDTTVYGLPYTDPRFAMVPGIAKKDGVITIKAGAFFKCQGSPDSGATTIVYMSNDPAEQ